MFALSQQAIAIYMIKFVKVNSEKTYITGWTYSL